MLLHRSMAAPQLVLPTFDVTNHSSNFGAPTNNNQQIQALGTASFTHAMLTPQIPSTQNFGLYYLESSNALLNNANGGWSFGKWAGIISSSGLPGDANGISINSANGLQTSGTYGFAINFVTKKIWFRHPTNGWTGAGGTAGDPVAGTNGIDFSGLNAGNYAVLACGGNTCIYTVNGGQTPFTYAIPTGYGLWGA